MSIVTFTNLREAINAIRTAFGDDKKDMPLSWAELLLLVAERGDEGITTKEIYETLNMSQGIASRTVKLMSTYYDKQTEQVDGYDLLSIHQDMVYRHRQRVRLTPKGWDIMNSAVASLENTPL